MTHQQWLGELGEKHAAVTGEVERMAGQLAEMLEAQESVAGGESCLPLPVATAPAAHCQAAAHCRSLPLR